MTQCGIIASLGAMTALAGSCGSNITCGEGTRLDEETKQCVPTAAGPDFNIIVDDFNIGEFAFTNTDVPEQMQPGFPDDRTFTITYTGEEDQEVTYVRISLVKVNENIDELRNLIDDIGSEPSCETDDECSAGTICSSSELVCKLNPILIGAVAIENLAAGEERQIPYTLSLPAEFDGEGVYGLMFSVNEIVVLKNEETGQYFEDPEHPVGLEDPLARAAALYAPATVLIGIPDKPNLRVLFASTDTSAFELSDNGTPIFNISDRISAQGIDITSDVTTRFELLLPGHVVQTPGQDLGADYFETEELFNAAPATSTYVYDANRTFTVLVEDLGGDLADSAVFQPTCANEDCTEQVVVENDLGRDGIYALHLSAADQKLLTSTLANAAQNETLDSATGEIAGTLRMVVSMEQEEYELSAGQPLVSDNEYSFDVVFMAPDPGQDATDADNDEPPPGGTALNMDNVFAPYPGGETENLTPTWAWSVGGDWMGAEAKIQNYTAKKRLSGAHVAQNLTATNYAKLKALKQTFDIIDLSGVLDFSTLRQLKNNKASAKLVLLGSTYLNANFDTLKGNCETENNFETCPVLSKEWRPRSNEKCTQTSSGVTKTCTPAEKPAPKKRWYLNYQREKRWFFAVGPLPFEIAVGVNAGLGMRGQLAFVQDRSYEPSVPVDQYARRLTGVQATLGPVADAGGSAFGGLSLGLLRAGVKGNINFVSVEFQPAIRVGQDQKYDNTNSCWAVNTGAVVFEGPLKLSVLSGDIKVAVDGGICFPWAGCAWGEIFSFTIVKIPAAYEKTWDLWTPKTWTFNSYDAGTGLCAAATPAAQSWTSPTSCSGNYCNYANGTGGYEKTFTRASGCGTLTINGEVEYYYDSVRVFDSAGNQTWSGTGTFTNVSVPFCAPSATVRLYSDYMVTKTGINVTAQ
ncbi:MAG: hypothetical protein ACO3JL_07530 [Myxococcota bacterium]